MAVGDSDSEQACATRRPWWTILPVCATCTP